MGYVRASRAAVGITVHVFRSKLLWQAGCHERVRVHNFGAAAVEVVLGLEVDADFADMFEVRGVTRRRRGERLPPRTTSDELVLAYEGLDGRS